MLQFILNQKMNLVLQNNTLLLKILKHYTKNTFHKIVRLSKYQLAIDDTQQFPKSLELYGIFGGGINLKGTHGIKMTLPFFNKKIDTTGTVPFKNIKFIDNDKQVLSKINF